ncbi:MAG: ECF transporter S component, partial [Clostridia bacterium]|nr:ECF transporter S component [Clostridia bacterium]
MNDARVKRIIMVSLFAALVCVATMVIRIPSPTGGYINPGDAVVLLAAFLLGPIWGAVAAAIGSSLAD